jgi:uncharacterized Fe-S cluster-containing radical SAM superfamily protein
MLGESHLCEVLRAQEIDVAHIDQSLTYRENVANLQKQFGVSFVEASNAKLDKYEMLARMQAKGQPQPEKAARERRTSQAPICSIAEPTRPYDPVARSREIERLVMRDHKRLAYKFRFQRFYGGIATCDCIGCNLLCAYCWNYSRNLNPGSDRDATFCSPLDVATRLETIAKRGQTDMARISGCEPFLGAASAKWLADIISNSDLSFVIETNGVMIGAWPHILESFKELRNFRIRLAFKGENALEFEKITSCDAMGYAYQHRAIAECQKRHIPLKVAFMPQFVSGRNIDV